MLRTLTIGILLHFTASAQAAETYDVVIYGGSAGGVAAAVQATRMGKTAIVVEPSQHLGGLTSGGLGATDIGNKSAIGGISREFYQRVKQHYSQDSAWVQQEKSAFRSGRAGSGEDAMWTFEPKVAEKIMEDFVRENKVTVMRGERLNLKQGVRMQNGRIAALLLESGKEVAGKMFIDATYEGDLLAQAGVSFTVGREANAKYEETLNGVQTKNARYHQIRSGVDPYVKAGDKASGLLPGIDPDGPGEEGAGDHRVQAYCFRMCLTDAPENRVPFEKPEGYDPLEYELLLRNFEAGETAIPWLPTNMPNRKTDTNNRLGVSTDFIGHNYTWPEGDYAAREKMYHEHLVYQKGLMWTLANHPRVPEKIRAGVSRWGNTKDEFVENGGWSHQLYVREGRRMVAGLVMTQHHCQGRQVVDDPVGMAAYTMDSHHVQRHLDEQGNARNEGDVQVGGFPPYPISYRSIIPREIECGNLLVPVCLSASHIAYGSIRMEPVFMVLGQSAATAAVLAIDADRSVQQIDHDQLQERLLKDKQVLQRVGQLPATKLSGIVVDDLDAKRTGEWHSSATIVGFVGRSYLHDNNEEKGAKSVRFTVKVPQSGMYEVRVSYSSNGNRATNVPITIEHATGQATATLNQRKPLPTGSPTAAIGKYSFSAEKPAVIEISNKETNGYVIVDAVQLLPVK